MNNEQRFRYERHDSCEIFLSSPCTSETTASCDTLSGSHFFPILSWIFQWFILNIFDITGNRDSNLFFPPNQETMTSILEGATNRWCLQTGNYRLTIASVYHGKSRTFIQMYGIDGSDAIGISDVSYIFAKF